MRHRLTDRAPRGPLTLAVLLSSSAFLGPSCAAPEKPPEKPPAAAPEQKNERAEPWRAEEPAKRARAKRIEAELQSLGEDHPWAGVYQCGDGYGVNVWIWLAPENGFAYQYRGSRDLIDLDHGEVVELSERHFRIEYAIEPSDRTWIREARQERRFFAEDFYAVDWGDEKMLVPSTQMVAFCNDVNDGQSMHSSPYPWRKKEGRNSRHLFEFIDLPTTPPAIPEEFEPYLLEEPLTGRITSIRAPIVIEEVTDNLNEYEVELGVSIGAEQGLLPGMILHIDHQRDRKEALVVEVGPESSTAKYRFLADPRQLGWVDPSAGLTVSTSRL